MLLNFFLGDKELSTFKIGMFSLHPSQLYISKKKLNNVKNLFIKTKKLEPIPIKKLNDRIIITDGHTRAFYLWSIGETSLEVEWDEDEQDWGMYQICVEWCLENGITSIKDLKERVINEEENKIKWLKKCKILEEKLLKKRK